MLSYDRITLAFSSICTVLDKSRNPPIIFELKWDSSAPGDNLNPFNSRLQPDTFHFSYHRGINVKSSTSIFLAIGQETSQFYVSPGSDSF